MRLILLFLLIGLSGASGVHAKEAVSAQSQPQTILVIGDSLSAAYGLDEADGWVSLAEATLQEQYPDINIVNASISGDTTEGAVRRLPMALERFEPDILIIELGGNDGLRGYPLKKMTENLQSLAEMGNQAGASVLILGMRIPSNYGPVYTEKFAEAFAEAAKASDAELVIVEK